MSDTLSVVRATIFNLSTFIAANIGVAAPTFDEIFTLIQTYVQTNGPVDIPLSQVSVDYETNKAEIESILITKPTWLDKSNAGTGQTIIQMIATALTYNQFAIVRAAQETMIPTAVIDSSIYTATVFLGVRLSRRIPAKHPVILTRIGVLTSSLVIDPYVQFVASSTFLFNRETIIFPADVNTVVANLYEGQTQQAAFTSDGSVYQTYQIGPDDYTVSDIDTIVTVNNLPWQRTEFQTYFNTGLWEYGPNAQVFEEDTSTDASVVVSFGNGLNGQIPNAGAAVNISYVITSGVSGNIDLTAQTVSCSSSQIIKGTITAIGSGGTDEKSAADYRTLAPALFFAKYRAVTRADQAAIARRYPGIIDVIFEGQQELHPTDLRYMMVTRATVLPNTVWNSDNWAAFIAWFSNLNVAQQIIIQNNPTAVPIDITANIYVLSSVTSLSSIENLILANIKAAFVLRNGILGYSRYLSDIGAIIENSDPAVDYYDIISPLTDTIVDRYGYVTLNSISLNIAYSTRSTLS